MTTTTKHIETLISAAAAQSDSGDAMRYAQAAVNAANALCAVASYEAALREKLAA